MRRLSTRLGFHDARRRLAMAGSLLLLPLSARLGLAQSAADFRLIVHPQNPAKSLGKAFLADAFLKKVTRWENGEVIRPVDQKADSAARRRFTETVLKKTVGAVRSYWQQRIFSGRDVPPPEVGSDDAVMAFVAKFPGALGYVSGAAKLSGVRELGVE